MWTMYAYRELSNVTIAIFCIQRTSLPLEIGGKVSLDGLITAGECGVLGVDTITLHLCRAANPTDHFFTISECSAGEVINIQSAEAGYSSLYDVSAPPLQCPWSNCTRPTLVPAALCNGVRRCRIRQEILLYPQGSVPALCDLSKDGNFIKIEMTCNAGKICRVNVCQ